jgi:hypothetical protein
VKLRWRAIDFQANFRHDCSSLGEHLSVLQQLYVLTSPESDAAIKVKLHVAPANRA